MWSVWHVRKEHNEIVVKVKKWKETDHKMKFRTLTAKAAARRYIKYNLYDRLSVKDGCPCCNDWSDPVDREKLKYGKKTAKTKYSVRIEIL